MSKLLFHIETIRLLRNEIDDPIIHKDLDNALDSIVHMAPEIIDLAWKKIFNVCSSRLTDMNVPSHRKCKAIYDERVPMYGKLFSVDRNI